MREPIRVIDDLHLEVVAVDRLSKTPVKHVLSLKDVLFHYTTDYVVTHCSDYGWTLGTILGDGVLVSKLADICLEQFASMLRKKDKDEAMNMVLEHYPDVDEIVLYTLLEAQPEQPFSLRASNG